MHTGEFQSEAVIATSRTGPAASSLEIASLGPASLDSPFLSIRTGHDCPPTFVADDDKILLDDSVASVLQNHSMPLAALELAGPRRKIFFNPSETGVGIVTCGGICPGLNDVIRGIVNEACHRYGVSRVYGFRYGYQGLVGKFNHPVMDLTAERVSEIHEMGGSILGSSRGQQDPVAIVDTLERRRVHILFCIGGDGTMRGAVSIAKEVKRRGLQIAVVGIPKTIDNDLKFLDRSFGFETAYTQAVEAIRCAHNEAKGCHHGIGLVKLMGRHSGFLACHATLATSHVNFCLIPEMGFDAASCDAFIEALRWRLERRQHAVVVVAEGTMQETLQQGVAAASDASGNARLIDVGTHLADRIKATFTRQGIDYSLKYIDPSYMVRSVPACPSDKVYCWRLAQNAVHAGMCGKTELVVGRWHGRMVHVPIEQAVSARNTVDTEGELWLSVLETTGQPAVFG